MDTSLFAAINEKWDHSIIAALENFIKIPNLSPAFDPDWQANGHMHTACQLITDWVQQQNIPGLKLSVHEEQGRAPLITLDIPGTQPQTALLYGHMDKQPPMTGWREGLGPFTPVIEGDKLYGRGGADDGYSVFAAVCAIAALKEANLPMPRCLVCIEASEESGSPDLTFYLEKLAPLIKTPELVVCLDSGCGNYDQLWLTTSLRGGIGGELKVSLLQEGIHSGYASGVVADSFRVLRALLSRLEDETTGVIKLEALHTGIPDDKLAQAQEVAKILKSNIANDLPLQPGTQAISAEPTQLLLNRTWYPQLTITAQEGLPSPPLGGSTMRAETALTLSMRTPPTCDVERAKAVMKEVLEDSPPYGAKVTFTPQYAMRGWSAPSLSPWLQTALTQASLQWFDKEVAFIGEGGGIPFMQMLGERFPEAQFVVTGVLGPNSNAHGPNEFLHIPMAKKVTASVASILEKYAKHCALQD